MKNIFFICVFSLIAFTGCTDDDELYKNSGKDSAEEETSFPNEEIDQHLFKVINLDYPGLEQVKAWYETGNYYSASKALLEYYRGRIGIINPYVSLNSITTQQARYAELALAENGYRFYINANYLEEKDLGNGKEKVPYSLKSGKEINWEFIPKGADKEYRKQLHRHNWIPFQAMAYQKTQDEIYMLGWKDVYSDWVSKFPKTETVVDEFAWWQLQVSTRLMGQAQAFEYFKFSSNFTPQWLSFFLVHFAEHADFLLKNRYPDENNILFSQIISMVFAGTLFPEFKDAPQWQAEGCRIINEQLEKQFLPDGMLSDLSLHYHIGILDELYNLKRLIQENHLPENLLTSKFDQILEKATEIVIHFTYPNYFEAGSNEYCTSAFNDSWMKTKNVLEKNFKKYAEMFPNNQELAWMATRGGQGHAPSAGIKVFENSGHYILRNGWDKTSTMLIHSNNYSNEKMDIWSHNQPDNGTFELYHNGRNFFPDSGVSSYEGSGTPNNIRSWFRQTKSHNTMILSDKETEDNDEPNAKRYGDEDIKNTLGKLIRKGETNQYQFVATENQGYANFTHRRSIFFDTPKEKPFFVIVDEGIGNATGFSKLYFHLCDDKTAESVSLDIENLGAHTTFSDNNNLFIRSFGNADITQNEVKGYISYDTKGLFLPRKAYSLVMDKKENSPVRYITVIYPVANETPEISARFTDDETFIEDAIKLEVTVNGQRYELGYTK